MNVSVLCDFDGTLMQQDVGAMISRTFADQEVRDAEIAAYQEGDRTLREISENIWATISTPPDEILNKILPNISLREGAQSFVNWCRQNGVAFEIVSSGYDFYIQALLQKFNLSADVVHCGSAKFVGGKFSPRYREQEKGAIAKEKQAAGLCVVAIGDGWSDHDLAEMSDFVFARAKLLDYCRVKGIACIPFKDFHEIATKIPDLIDA